MTDIEREMNQMVAEITQEQSPGLYNVIKDLTDNHKQSAWDIQTEVLRHKPHTPSWLLIQIAMTATHIQEMENAEH